MRILPAVIALLVSAPAFAFEMPPRKAGLWELRMVHEGRPIPPQQIRQCVDAATDKVMNENFGGMSQAICPEKNIQTIDGTLTIDSVCKFGNGAMSVRSRAVVSGSLESAYTVKVTSSIVGGAPIPGVPAGGDMHSTIEGRYLGACAAGQKPGDIIMANGMKINVMDVPKGGSEAMVGR